MAYLSLINIYQCHKQRTDTHHNHPYQKWASLGFNQNTLFAGSVCRKGVEFDTEGEDTAGLGSLGKRGGVQGKLMRG